MTSYAEEIVVSWRKVRCHYRISLDDNYSKFFLILQTQFTVFENCDWREEWEDERRNDEYVLFAV